MSAGPPPVPGGRSEEERERARLEREARRTGRTADNPVIERPPRRMRAARPPKQPKPPKAPKAARAPREPRVRRLRADRNGGDPGRSLPRRALLPLIGLGVVLLVVLWFLVSLFQPLKGDGQGAVRVTIPPGSGVSAIGHKLADANVVSSPFFFQLRTRLGGNSGNLKPGAYTLKHDMSYSDAITALTKGPAANTVSIGIPEGRSRREIARSIKSAGLRGNYLTATKRSPELNPARYGAKRARDLEGFLFPATYELKRGASVDALVSKQLQTFKAEFRRVDLRAARKANLTPYDVLIIASLVEREAQLPRERALVASVIYNRLRQGTPLGIDATTRFEFDKWDGALRQSELASRSPYNTRLNNGLPPGPIGNPGIASIRAAANPAHSSFMFYVVKPGACGEHQFTRTLAEFNAAVERYKRARAAAGNKSPTNC
ncbi:MAG: hypothetical protein QOE08_1182 [Thermoleophilaceae bacterium]|nr:hypothetical protein [Thermoleophilaceae bacterium]